MSLILLSFLSHYRSIGRISHSFRMFDKLLLFAFLLILILLCVIYYSKQLLTSFYLAGQLKQLLDSKIQEQQRLLQHLQRQNATTQTGSSSGLSLHHPDTPRPRHFVQRFGSNSNGQTHNQRPTQSGDFQENRQRFPSSQFRPPTHHGTSRRIGWDYRPIMRVSRNNGQARSFRQKNRNPRQNSLRSKGPRPRHQQDTNQNPTTRDPLRDSPRHQGANAPVLLVVGDISRENEVPHHHESEDTGDGESLPQGSGLCIPT